MVEVVAVTSLANEVASHLIQLPSLQRPSFGEGVVIAVEGDGDNKRVQVNFQSEGLKWLVLGYANLKIM